MGAADSVTDIDPEAVAARAGRLYERSRQSAEAAFDHEVVLVGHTTLAGRRHRSSISLSYADSLLEEGTPESVAVAEQIIERVTSTQERHPGDPHHGNFPWMYEDPVVTDLNSVQFVLEGLLTLCKDHHPRLSGATRERILEAVRLGLAELERLDVSVAYTNIALLDTFNSIVGGEITGEPRFAERGYRRLEELIRLTNETGAPREYNSPTYASVDLAALAAIAAYTENREAGIKAQLLEERIWLHVGMRYHPETAQLAGPYCRHYQRGLAGAGSSATKTALFLALGDERLLGGRHGGGLRLPRIPRHFPPNFLAACAAKPYPYLVRERTECRSGYEPVDITTYLTGQYALGSANVTYGQIADNLKLYYRRDRTPGYGLLYTRFAVEETEDGAAAAPDPTSQNRQENEQGLFWSVQDRNRVIALYGLDREWRTMASVGATVTIADREQFDGIWVNDRPVEVLPARLQPLDRLVVQDCRTLIGIIPLEPSQLGWEAPIVLEEQNGDLVLSLYNYRGPAKPFWEYGSVRGSAHNQLGVRLEDFYHGNVRNGFILEVSDTGAFASVDAFRRHLASTVIDDSTAAGAVRQVRYRSGQAELALTVDLFQNRLLERRIGDQIVAPPMLEAPNARMARGRVTVGAAALTSEDPEAVVWLVADEARSHWAANLYGRQATAIALETSAAALEVEGLRFARVAFRVDGAPASVDIISPDPPVAVHMRGLAAGPQEARVTWNGGDAADRVA